MRLVIKIIIYVVIILLLIEFLSCDSFEYEYDPRDHNPVELKLEPEDSLFVLEPENWIDFQLIRTFESGRRENLLWELSQDTTRHIYINIDNDTTVTVYIESLFDKIRVSPLPMQWGVWERECAVSVRYVETRSKTDSTQWYFNKSFIIRQNLFPSEAHTIIVKNTVVTDLLVSQYRGFFSIEWNDTVQGQQFYRHLLGMVEKGPNFFAREVVQDTFNLFIKSELRGIWMNPNYASCIIIDTLYSGRIDTTVCTILRID